jgi:hypothetical protein
MNLILVHNRRVPSAAVGKYIEFLEKTQNESNVINTKLNNNLITTTKPNFIWPSRDWENL